MLRRIDDPNPMGRIAEKGRPRLHGFQNTVLAFHAQCFWNVTRLGNPSSQGFGLMGIELIHHKNPTGLGGQGDRPLQMGEEIRFGSCVTHRRADDLAGHHIKIRQEALGPVTGIFKLHPFHVAGSHRLDALTFQGLDAGHLIRTHRVNAVFRQGLGLFVRRTHGIDAVLKALRIIFRRLEPIAVFMRV